MSQYPAAGIDEREGLQEHSRFLGLRNNVGDEGFELGDLAVATNVDLDDALELHRRYGYSAPVVAGVDRCLWAEGSVCLGVGGNALKLVLPDYSTRTLRSGLTPGRSLDYDAIAARVYYSNGVENGVVENGANRTWGLAIPSVPVATATGGLLLAGDYQFAVTYVRNDGQESGTGRAGTITLTAIGGVSLTGISVSSDPTVIAKNIYAAPVGGKTLYLCGTIANATTTFVIAAVQHDAYPLATQFLGPPPAGDYLDYFKGWMLVAKDNRLYPSEAYAPELFDLRKSLPFLDRITMVAALNNKTDSLWIGTESQVLWLDGDSPDKWSYQTAANYGVIPRTVAYADGEVIGNGEADRGNTVVLFATARGICVGHSDGTFRNLTEARFAYPSMDVGAGVVRKHRGIVQYLVSLEGTEVAGNVAT